MVSGIDAQGATRGGDFVWGVWFVFFGFGVGAERVVVWVGGFGDGDCFALFGGETCVEEQGS